MKNQFSNRAISHIIALHLRNNQLQRPIDVYMLILSYTRNCTYRLDMYIPIDTGAPVNNLRLQTPLPHREGYMQ